MSSITKEVPDFTLLDQLFFPSNFIYKIPLNDELNASLHVVFVAWYQSRR